jgi:hypothetical protein
MNIAYEKGHNNFFDIYEKKIYEKKISGKFLIIGSGSGTVPIFFYKKILKKIKYPQVILLDPIIKNVGYGCPFDECGFIYKLSKFNLKYQRIIFLTMTSISGFKVFYRSNFKFEIVYIDGNHSFKFVLEDLLKYSKIAKTLMLHDYNLPGVKNAVKIFKKEKKIKRFKEYSQRPGLCVIDL